MITKHLTLLLFIGLAWGQEEWIYYNNYGLLISESATHRIRPDNSETELYKDGLSLLDISEDEETFLYESYNNIYKVNSSTVDTLELQNIFYYARFTQIENEIIYYKPTIGQWGKDKIYKYSFNDNETTLLADSLYRFANPHSLMSPSKDKFAYFKSDFSSSGYYQLYVVDIQSGQETFLDSIQNSVNIWMPPNYYWATDGFLYLNIANNNGLHLYKIHSSDTEIPLEQVTEGNIYLRLLGSHSTHLDKLLLTSFSDSVISNLYVYELETGQLSYIDSIQGEYPTTQTWAKDNSKVAIGSQLSLWESYTSIQIYDFTNDTIIVLSDSAEPLFWLGGQELGINNNLESMPSNYFLGQNFPNPFNPTTTIGYNLSENSHVNITIYDILGNKVNNLITANKSLGYKSIKWDATNYRGQPVSAGVYLYSIEAGDFRQTKKMILLK